jgi:hypothetical protein
MDALAHNANASIGAVIARTLLDVGHRVRVFVCPAAERRSLEGLSAQVLHGEFFDRRKAREALALRPGPAGAALRRTTR